MIIGNIIDGKAVSEKIKKDLKKEIESFGLNPCLAILEGGENKASNVYIKRKKEFAEYIGVKVEHYKFESQTDLISKIEELNNNTDISGIIVQLPLGPGFKTKEVLSHISKDKDVDCLNDSRFLAVPARGILTLFENYNIDVLGKKVVVVGNSEFVGSKITEALGNMNAEVISCDASTTDLSSETQKADILIVAVGKPGLITKDMVKNKAVVIDVGTTFVNGELKGDVEFTEVSKKASLITPVPGGVGPMTVASLFQNLLDATNS